MSKAAIVQEALHRTARLQRGTIKRPLKQTNKQTNLHIFAKFSAKKELKDERQHINLRAVLAFPPPPSLPHASVGSVPLHHQHTACWIIT